MIHYFYFTLRSTTNSPPWMLLSRLSNCRQEIMSVQFSFLMWCRFVIWWAVASFKRASIVLLCQIIPTIVGLRTMAKGRAGWREQEEEGEAASPLPLVIIRSECGRSHRRDWSSLSLAWRMLWNTPGGRKQWQCFSTLAATVDCFVATDGSTMPLPPYPQHPPRLWKEWVQWLIVVYLCCFTQATLFELQIWHRLSLCLPPP